MIPMERFTSKYDCREECEHDERNNLLYHLELHECEWTSVTDKADAIGWNLTRVFSQGDNPRKEDNQI